MLRETAGIGCVLIIKGPPPQIAVGGADGVHLIAVGGKVVAARLEPVRAVSEYLRDVLPPGGVRRRVGQAGITRIRFA